MWINNAKIETAQEKIDKATVAESIRVRKESIDLAREASGIREVDIETAESWIDTKIDQATTVEELKTQLKVVLKKMIPYILN